MLHRAVWRLQRAPVLFARCEGYPAPWPRWPPATSPFEPPTRAPRSPIWSPGSTHLASTATTTSSTRWKARQSRDTYSREAKLAGLKSRAAFKLLEINEKYRLFRRGDTVVDLGYAPGSWSQVAISKTQPGGRVVGIDVIPAQPPKGVSTIQGNFLSAEIREEVRRFVQDPARGRARAGIHGRAVGDGEEGLTEEELEEESRGLIERERQLDEGEATYEATQLSGTDQDSVTQKARDTAEGRVVNVVLSDMSEPWPQTSSMWIKSISNPYRRMMNTSGMPFRDHAGSMDLCDAALTFCYNTLMTGGHFLCKFYQGSEDHAFEQRLKKLFEKVHRIKPDSSRKESKEAYFVGLRRRAGVRREDVLNDNG